MSDVYVKSYSSGGKFDVSAGFFAKNVYGQIIIDSTTTAGLNLTASKQPLSYYTNSSLSSNVRFSTDALVLPNQN